MSLQYADDTIVFVEHREQNLRNLKCSLVWFESLSGMRINYHKSEIIPCNLSLEEVHLANWESVSMAKDFGGLGVPNLRD